VALVSLPTPNSWEVPAYIHFGDPDPAVLVALCRRWQERWGAEIVAHYGTMLEFSVLRPPTTFEEALAPAREQIAVAADTTVLPGVPFAEHVTSLVGRSNWFLHSRP